MIVLPIPPDKFLEVNLLVEDSIDGIAPEQISDVNDTSPNTSERLNMEWIVLGYILCLFPLIGLFVCITLSASSKRLHDGKRSRCMIALRSCMDGSCWLPEYQNLDPGGTKNLYLFSAIIE
jgi:hypothetical protein